MTSPVTITEDELKTDFDAILDRAAAGEVFRIVAVDGKAVVMLGIDAYRALTGKRFTATIEQDENGAFIRIPDEVLAHLGWQEGDNLVWTLLATGSASVRCLKPGEAADPAMISRLINVG